MKNNLGKGSMDSKKRSDNFKSVLSRYGLVLIFFILVIILTSVSPVFFSGRNILNVLRQVSAVGVLAVGVTFVIISGGIDLSIGAIASFAGVVAASIGQNGNLTPVAVIAGIGVGVVCGSINGFFISKARVAPFIVTLATMAIFRGVSQLYTGGRPVSNLSESYNLIGGGFWLGIPNPVLILFGVLVLAFFVLHSFKYGRHVVAVGGNEIAAKVSGINTTSTVFGVYVIAGALSGLAGVILTARLNTGSPLGAMGMELEAIAASVIGGTSLSGGIGTIPGVFLGAIVVGVIKNGLDLLNVSGYWQQIVKGAIILLAVTLEKQFSRFR